jgi:hypothetical protein
VAEAVADRVRGLQTFALERLPSMRLDDGAFCFEVEAPGLAPSGRSLRYTLMCLLGLQRARRAGLDVPVAPAELLRLAVDEIGSPEMTLGDLGLLLWADARDGWRWHDKVAFTIHGRIGAGFPDVEGLELAWVVTGAAESGADLLLDDSLERLLRRVDPASGLIRHHDAGWRARFPNFATQIYGVLALTIAASRGRDHVLSAARRTADRLIELQRPDGGWPWIYDTRSGRVVEPYELYSVHQDGMAPMALLELSEVSGEPRYREAALRGVEWIFGRNDLGRTLLDRDAGILYRSIRRRRGFDRGLLYLNTAGAMAGGAPFAAKRWGIEVNPTDRPYHLGWVLEAWSGREPADRTQVG